MIQQHIIYCLTDPTTNEIFYIGYTSDQKTRYSDHCNNKQGTKAKRIIVNHLKKLGLKPIMKVIEVYKTAEELPKAEEVWYDKFRSDGFELAGNDPFYIGGASNKGRKHSDETKTKISVARKSKDPHANMTEDGKAIMNAKMSASHQNKTPEEKAIIAAKKSAALKGNKLVNGKRVWSDK